MDKTKNKMKQVIQITDKILGVIVDDEYTRFMIDEIDFYEGQFLLAAKEKGSYSVIKSFDDKHIIHGTCTLPNYDFDFIYGTGSYDTMTLKMRIKKALNDLGLYAVNPYKKPENYELWEKYGSFTQYGESLTIHSLLWQSAESKTVKKILIIEKINQ